MLGLTGSSAPSVSVILPAHNAGETIAGQIAAVCRQVSTQKYESIVVDDASTDRTPAIAANAAAEHGT